MAVRAWSIFPPNRSATVKPSPAGRLQREIIEMAEHAQNAAAHDHHDHKTHGWRRWGHATKHKDIGTMYLVFAGIMFFLGGMMAMVIRTVLF